MKRTKILPAVAVAAMLATSTANATIATFFDDIFAGPTTFDSIVTGAGGTVMTDTWSGLPASSTSVDRGDYTITKPGGATFFNQGIYTLWSSSPTTTTTGETIGINPSSTDVNTSRSSGLTLTFDSPINAVGFEVGDWATCCQPSNLYIAFDAGAPILVGESTVFGDQFLTNGGAGVFVGAADDSGTFSSMTFWGNGLGEYLVMGGTIRYAAVQIGGLPSVPEPTGMALLGLGLAGLGFARRRKSA